MVYHNGMTTNTWGNSGPVNLFLERFIVMVIFFLLHQNSGLEILLFSTTENLNKKCANGKRSTNIQWKYTKKTLYKNTMQTYVWYIMPCIQNPMITWFICCWWMSIKAYYAAIMELPRGHFDWYISPTLYFLHLKNQIGYVIFRNNSQLFTGTIRAIESPALRQVMKKE